MLGALFDYFYSIFESLYFSNNGNYDFEHVQFTLFGDLINFADYFAFISSLVSLVFIFVLCCLFIYKIIKLVGGLIR